MSACQREGGYGICYCQKCQSERSKTDPTPSSAMEEARKIADTISKPRGVPVLPWLVQRIARVLSEQNDLILKREAECRAVEAQLRERERVSIVLRRCRGALADAETVTTDDVEAGIRSLTAQLREREREAVEADEATAKMFLTAQTLRDALTQAEQRVAALEAAIKELIAHGVAPHIEAGLIAALTPPAP